MEGSLKTLDLGLMDHLRHPSKHQAQREDYPARICEGASCLMEGIDEVSIGDPMVFEDVTPMETLPTDTGRETGKTK